MDQSTKGASAERDSPPAVNGVVPMPARESRAPGDTLKRVWFDRGERPGDVRFRLAALNLMEDAKNARRHSEEASAQREHAETQARASQAEFKASFETSLVGKAMAEPTSYRMVRVNAALCGMLRYREDELVGKPFTDIVYPVDVAGCEASLKSVLGDGGGDHRAELRFVAKDGAIVWGDVAVNAVRDEAGHPVRIVAVVQDITSRKDAEAARLIALAALRASEARLRLIVENARDFAIISLDVHRRITSWNAGARSIVGYTAEEVIGQSGDLIFTVEDRNAGAPALEAHTAMRDDRSSDERWHVRKDGSRFWGSGVMMAMRDGTGEVIGLLKIFRDQTAELQAKEALERSRGELIEALQETQLARAEAEAAGRAKDHFLAVLSHELRTPLTPVMIAAHAIARRKDLPEPVLKAIAMIRRNVQLEARFVDDLLDVTRIARGKMELAREPMDLHAAIEEAIDISRPDLDAKGQRLRVSLQAPEHHVNGDFSRLQQVVWNLLKNASKFSAHGAEIELHTRNLGDRVVLEVADEGIGIEEGKLVTIFDPFVQADEGISRQFGGLGLGLAIARATVTGHEGELYARSEGKGRGATFYVALPFLARAGKEPDRDPS